jgi:uncharacterized protein YndB with AHSA1/START domain
MQQVIFVEKSIVVKATPAKLFKAITHAKELTKWLCDRAESDPRPGGQVISTHDGHEARGIYRRFIPNQEVAIEWEKHEHDLALIEDLTVYRLERTAQGTRIHVVDFALPDEVDTLSAGWDQQLKKLKRLYQAKPAARKPAPKKKAVAKRKVTKKAKPAGKSKRVKR